MFTGFALFLPLSRSRSFWLQCIVVVSEAGAYAPSNCSVGKGQREVLVWYDLPASIASVLQSFFHVSGDNIVGFAFQCVHAQVLKTLHGC